jgi:hypothetical protein
LITSLDGDLLKAGDMVKYLNSIGYQCSRIVNSHDEDVNVPKHTTENKDESLDLSQTLGILFSTLNNRIGTAKPEHIRQREIVEAKTDRGVEFHTLTVLQKMEQEIRALRKYAKSIDLTHSAVEWEIPVVSYRNIEVPTSSMLSTFRPWESGSTLFLKGVFDIDKPHLTQTGLKGIRAKLGDVVPHNATSYYDVISETLPLETAVKASVWMVTGLTPAQYMGLVNGQTISDVAALPGVSAVKVDDVIPMRMELILDNPPTKDNSTNEIVVLQDQSNQDVSIAFGVLSVMFALAAIVAPEAAIVGVGLSTISDKLGKASTMAKTLIDAKSTISDSHPPYGEIPNRKWSTQGNHLHYSFTNKISRLDGSVGPVVSDNYTTFRRISPRYETFSTFTQRGPWNYSDLDNRLLSDIAKFAGTKINLAVDAEIEVELGEIPFSITEMRKIIPPAESLGEPGLWQGNPQYTGSYTFRPEMVNYQGNRIGEPYNMLVLEDRPIAFAQTGTFAPGDIMNRGQLFNDS